MLTPVNAYLGDSSHIVGIARPKFQCEIAFLEGVTVSKLHDYLCILLSQEL